MKEMMKKMYNKVDDVICLYREIVTFLIFIVMIVLGFLFVATLGTWYMAITIPLIFLNIYMLAWAMDV